MFLKWLFGDDFWFFGFILDAMIFGVGIGLGVGWLIWG